MRLAYMLPAALLVTACGVPEVTFDAGGGGTHDASRDSSQPLDAQGEAANDAEPGDGEGDAADAADAGDASDAADGAVDWCKGDAGMPNGFKCCTPAGSGVVCGSTSCTQGACAQCQTLGCTWPMVCCGSGPNGACKPAGSC